MANSCDAIRRCSENAVISPPAPLPESTLEVCGRALAEAMLMGEGGCLHAILRAGLLENVGDVSVHGIEADHQSRADLAVALARGQQAQHLDLALAQTGRIRRTGASGRVSRVQRRNLLLQAGHA